ncbi:MAG: hypothetical protein C5B57_07715 [Blastocatellia bacterium]|nr:MAG: hypothetical protein C5B57_07715 [Blastocatellia bacterium]
MAEQKSHEKPQSQPRQETWKHPSDQTQPSRSGDKSEGDIKHDIAKKMSEAGRQQSNKPKR